MSVTDEKSNLQASNVSFTKVQNTGSLRDGFLSIVRNNEDPYVSRAKHSEQTADGLTALYAGVIIGTNPRNLENTGVSPI